VTQRSTGQEGSVIQGASGARGGDPLTFPALIRPAGFFGRGTEMICASPAFGR